MSSRSQKPCWRAPNQATRKSRFWSEPDKVYVARLRELAPSADQMTRTYQAKFSLPGVGDDVQLGMTATLTLSEHESERVARLPLSALFNQGQGPSVYAVDPGTGTIALKHVAVKID